MSKKLLCLALVLLAWPALAQDTPPRPSTPQAVDPTENVKALNAAEAKRQDDLRNLEVKFLNAMREKEAEVAKVARDAEMKRINDLAAQKQLFDLELARVLKANVDSLALLLSTQVKELKTDSNDRISKLEQRAYESSGRGSGIDAAGAWLVAAFMGLIAFGGLAVAFINMRRPVVPARLEQ